MNDLYCTIENVQLFNNADAATRDGLPVGTTTPSLKGAMIALKVECAKRAKHGGYNLLWNCCTVEVLFLLLYVYVICIQRVPLKVVEK